MTATRDGQERRARTMKRRLRDFESTKKMKEVILKVRKMFAAALIAIILPLNGARRDE
jgi:hypothetical protein